MPLPSTKARAKAADLNVFGENLTQNRLGDLAREAGLPSYRREERRGGGYLPEALMPPLTRSRSEQMSFGESSLAASLY